MILHTVRKECYVILICMAKLNTRLHATANLEASRYQKPWSFPLPPPPNFGATQPHLFFFFFCTRPSNFEATGLNWLICKSLGFALFKSQVIFGRGRRRRWGNLFPRWTKSLCSQQIQYKKMAGTWKQDGEQDTAAAYFSSSYLLDLPKGRYRDVKLCTQYFIPSQQSEQYRGSF